MQMDTEEDSKQRCSTAIHECGLAAMMLADSSKGWEARHTT